MSSSARAARHSLARCLLTSALALCCGGTLGCGSSAPGADTESLRLAVGLDPLDLIARAALAHRASAEGRPGEALRELLFVHERDSVEGKDRRLLGELLSARGTERLAVGDSNALADLRLATSLGQELGSRDISDASALCVVAAWRHSSEYKHARGDACLDEVHEEHLLHRAHSLGALTTDELGRLLDVWLFAGARKRALKVAEAYVDAGGLETPRLVSWVGLHRWWYGATRPLLPVAAARAAPAEYDALERFSRGLAVALQTTSGPAALAGDWGVRDWSPDVDELIAAYRLDPARADRLARRWVDRAVYGLRERALVSELFHRLGDSDRARSWAQELVDLAPELPAAQEAAGLAHAASGQSERGALFATAAAAASGDAGATWSRAARVLRQSGEALAALAAGKRALSLTARGWDATELWEIAQAQQSLGRTAHAEATLEALWGRFPLAQRRAARVLATRSTAVSANALEGRHGNGPGRSFTLLGPIRGSLGFRD